MPSYFNTFAVRPQIVMLDRIYQLRDGIPFRAGHLPNGEQILVSRIGCKAIAVRFSKEGDVLGCESYSIGAAASVPDAEVDMIVNQLRVTAGVIRFRAFVLPEYGIEIRDIPPYLQEYIDAPEAFSAEDGKHLTKAIDGWRRRGGFVILWCEDYEMSAAGEVEST